MRRFSIFMVGLTVVLAVVLLGGTLYGTGPGENLEYKVLAIDTGTWLVTAQEVETGNVVKFRMPPTMFKGQTFDASLDGVNPGQRFSAKGSANARLNQLVMEQPLADDAKRQMPERLETRKMMPMDVPLGSPLGWEILDVNPQQLIVTAKNRGNNRVIKFKIDPNGFIGYQFRANLRGVSKGRGFSIIAPNEAPFANMCTLLE